MPVACRSGRPKSTFTIRQNWIAPSENTGKRLGAPRPRHLPSHILVQLDQQRPALLQGNIVGFPFRRAVSGSFSIVIRERLAYKASRATSPAERVLQHRPPVLKLLAHTCARRTASSDRRISSHPPYRQPRKDLATYPPRILRSGQHLMATSSHGVRNRLALNGQPRGSETAAGRHRVAWASGTE